MKPLKATLIAFVGVNLAIGIGLLVFQRVMANSIVTKYRDLQREFDELADRISESQSIPPKLPASLHGIGIEAVTISGQSVVFAFITPSPDVSRCLVFNYKCLGDGRRVVEFIKLNEQWAYCLLL